MTTREQNEILTRMGPGAPIGELFRRYRIPAPLPEERPEPDGPPAQPTLLFQRMIAFRDGEGRLGLIGLCRKNQAQDLFAD